MGKVKGYWILRDIFEMHSLVILFCYFNHWSVFVVGFLARSLRFLCFYTHTESRQLTDTHCTSAVYLVCGEHKHAYVDFLDFVAQLI